MLVLLLYLDQMAVLKVIILFFGFFTLDFSNGEREIIFEENSRGERFCRFP
jgi:hypothetical protein